MVYARRLLLNVVRLVTSARLNSASVSMTAKRNLVITLTLRK